MPPKLVVGIVVDQMRYDYLHRFWNKFGDRGFKKLVNEGFFCKNIHYNYAPTYTAPGHASIYTGTTPAIHGIIGNNWFAKETNARIYCTDDNSVQTVGSTSAAGEMSPKNLLSSTITDELRLATNFQSKVIGISLKDRGSILPAGHLANAAYWFDSQNGAFITSTHYMKTLPSWVDVFNKKDLGKQYLTQSWNTLLPLNQYTESLPDDNAYEGRFKGETKPVFPHNLPEIVKNEGVELIRSTPFGNSIVTDFAMEAIRAEQLGKGAQADFLAVSFSSTDYVGHKYGPRSVELEDTYLRLDQELGKLLDFLETQLGHKNVLIFLTADHAGVEVPSFLMDSKMPAGYVDPKNVAELKSFLFQTYGDSLVADYINQQVYLKQASLEAKKLNFEEVVKVIQQKIQQWDGVASTLPGMHIQEMSFPNGPNQLIQNGYHPRRSGDIAVNLMPAWIEYSRTGTTHGSPYAYDTHVPLLWYGWKIKPGSTVAPLQITDIAPTLAFFLNTALPNGCTGKPIEVLFK